MIIVSGKIYVRPGTRERFVAQSSEAVRPARQAEGCQDFVVAADPVETDRVNVYEEWDSVEALLSFRGNGPGDDVSANIVRAAVREYEAVPRAV